MVDHLIVSSELCWAVQMVPLKVVERVEPMVAQKDGVLGENSELDWAVQMVPLKVPQMAAQWGDWTAGQRVGLMDH